MKPLLIKPLPPSNNVFVAVGIDPLLNGHEVKDISYVIPMCACEGIGALGYSFKNESLLSRSFGGTNGGTNYSY